MASRRVAANRFCARDEYRDDNSEQQHYQQDGKHEQPAARVAEIYGPAEAVAPGNKHGRVVGIIVTTPLG